MKKKQAMVVLGMAICMTSLTAGSICASEAGAQGTEQAAEILPEGSNNVTQEEKSILGEVASVAEGTVKILVGTRKEMAPGDSSEDRELSENGEVTEDQKGEEYAQGEPGQQSSILELTGEEQEIAVTENTVITKQSMGQPGGLQGETRGGENGEAPEKPDDENKGAPEKPDGGNGEVSEKPDDENGGAPEKPDDENKEALEKPDGENGEVSEKPDDENGGAPGKPDGGNGEIQEMPPSGMPGGQSDERITWEDIQEGDTVSIILDEEGNAAGITVISVEMGGMGQPGGGHSGQPDSYTAVTEYTEDTVTEGETFASTGIDESAVLISDGASVTVKNAEITQCH